MVNKTKEDGADVDDILQTKEQRPKQDDDGDLMAIMDAFLESDGKKNATMDAILESFTEWEDPAGDDILQTKEQRPKQDDDGDLMVFHEKNMAEAAKEFMSHIKV